MAKKVKAKKKFWAFRALANNEGELTIYGEIADSQGALVTVTKEVGQANGSIVTQNILNMWARCWGRSRQNAV